MFYASKYKEKSYYTSPTKNHCGKNNSIDETYNTPLFRLPFANDRKRQAAFFLNIFAWVFTTVTVIVGHGQHFCCMNGSG